MQNSEVTDLKIKLIYSFGQYVKFCSIADFVFRFHIWYVLAEFKKMVKMWFKITMCIRNFHVN